MRTIVLTAVLLAALVAGGIFLLFTLSDYAALQVAYQRYERVAAHPTLLTLAVAESRMQIHRINVFAEGVWALLAFLIAAVALHGMCTLRREG